MKKLRLILLIIFAFNVLSGQCQKNIEIPKNKKDTLFYNWIHESIREYQFDDLRISEDTFRLRIWLGNQIVELVQADSIYAIITNSIYSLNKESEIIESILVNSKTSRELYDSLYFYGIKNFPTGKSVGIDGQEYLFEISTLENYKLISYWSPGLIDSPNSVKIRRILDMIYSKLNLNQLQEQFFQELAPGNYQANIITFSIDYFLSKEANKSALYDSVENMMRSDLNINNQTNHLDYPLILVNEEQRFLYELNEIELSKVKSIKIIKSLRAILIETNK